MEPALGLVRRFRAGGGDTPRLVQYPPGVSLGWCRCPPKGGPSSWSSVIRASSTRNARARSRTAITSLRRISLRSRGRAGALADPGPTRSFNGHRGDGAWRRRARRGRTRQAPGLAGVAVGLGAWPAWSGARALTRCRYLCAQRPRLAVRRPASAAGTGRTQRSGFGVALTCGTLSSITLGRADPGGPTATAAGAAGGDGIQAADAGSEAPTDHGRWPTGTFWPASKTPCYADRK